MAAVQSCFLFTFQAVARASRLDFISIDLSVEGKVDRRDGTTRFTEIILRPRLRVPPGGDPDRASKVLDRSEKACLVSASLSTPILIQPDIVRGLNLLAWRQ